uniref:LIM zinc-binding domain-containing protein n=1 Tax=Periophthalmus magnuspinnatus TaxID=409849 RepID=A0A3B4BFP4_9GOBI
AETGDPEADSSITLAEVTEAVGKVLGGKAPGVDEIRPEYLKSLDVVGLSWFLNIGGAGSYVYDPPANDSAIAMATDSKPHEKKTRGPVNGEIKTASFSSFSGPNVCPLYNGTVYFAEENGWMDGWHRPCLACERCHKTLTPGGHAEHDGQPYGHKPCYAVLFRPKDQILK